MIAFDEWDKWVDYCYDYWGKGKIRVTRIDGSQYEGVCEGYSEEEDSNGYNVYSICVGSYIFIQEQVKKIELVND